MKHEEEADRLEQQADRLEEHSEEVGDHIEEARGDWEQKQSAQDVPGAQSEPEEHPFEDEEEEAEE